MTPDAQHDFQAHVASHGVDLSPRSIETLQINLTKRCNQACRHCHVDASPARTESLAETGIDTVLALLDRHPGIRTLDLTGGAPELHPRFRDLVRSAVGRGRHVMVRHNLTVTFDPHPGTGEDLGDLPAFFAAQGVEVISSLPYHQAAFTDRQRGNGVFDKSIRGLRALNALGYGQPGSGRQLNLVYNPVGPYLPPAQSQLEADYRRALGSQFGVVFNQLFTITNIPINRFRLHLEKSGQYQRYLDKLESAFNPAAAANVMCRDLISVDHDGRLYDCDFNQQIGLPIEHQGQPLTLADFDTALLMRRRIRTGAHCFGCTAGAGSSCGGATT